MFESRFDQNIFKDMDTVESLPRDRVLDFLLKNKQVSFSSASLNTSVLKVSIHCNGYKPVAMNQFLLKLK